MPIGWISLCSSIGAASSVVTLFSCDADLERESLLGGRQDPDCCGSGTKDYFAVGLVGSFVTTIALDAVSLLIASKDSCNGNTVLALSGTALAVNFLACCTCFVPALTNRRPICCPCVGFAHGILGIGSFISLIASIDLCEE